MLINVFVLRKFTDHCLCGTLLQSFFASHPVLFTKKQINRTFVFVQHWHIHTYVTLLLFLVYEESSLFAYSIRPDPQRVKNYFSCTKISKMHKLFHDPLPSGVIFGSPCIFYQRLRRTKIDCLRNGYHFSCIVLIISVTGDS